jgi:DSF synthase
MDMTLPRELVPPSPAGRKHSLARRGDARPSQFEVEFDPEYGVLWGMFNPKGMPCFSLGLLNDIRAHDEQLELNQGRVLFEGETRAAHYYVAGSKVKGVFNLGGDLALFTMLIQAGDREALARYARRCIDCIHPRIQHYGVPTLTTISLVQGDALGGGFETALSSDVIIAEESATMGLPEILFNLFPGMGALSLLSRRLGLRAAEEFILGGRILKAKELADLGLVDVVAPDGMGEYATYQWIAKNERRRNGMQAVFHSRNIVHPISREELDRVADAWVDAALRLDEKDLRMMKRLVAAQQRRLSADVPAPARLDEAKAAA